AEKELFIAKKDEDRAFAVLVPRLSAFGEYKKYDEDKNALPEYSQAWGARLDQSFTLNGKELTGFQMAKDNIEKSRFDLDAARILYLFNVAATYYTVLKNQKGLEIAESDVKRLKAYKKAIQLRLELKDTPKTELYRAEAELSGSETVYVATKNSLRYARISLARLVELPKGYMLTPPEKMKSDREYPALEKLIHNALLKRVDLKSLHMAGKISKSEIDYYKGAHWPTLSIEGVYIGMDSDPDSYYPDDESVHVGLNLNFPIYEGGLRVAEISQARARNKQVALQIKDFSKQVVVDVEHTWLELKTSESSMDSLGDRLKSAKENYDAVSQRYKHGLADSLDVIDANSLLLRSERGLLEAKYNYKLSVLNLERAEGSFLENIQQKIKKKMRIDTDSPDQENDNNAENMKEKASNHDT
ncbi:MAG: TolC family protein, partial [Deltaproteobacteria bacterium]|nr:TolC family protein [Deltaproteobacteria bacterium]